MRVILACLLFVGIAFAKPDGYTTKYDNINLDEILHNDRLYQKYFDCLADNGPCTPDGKELKEALPDALKTECKKCSENQKKGFEKVLKYIIDNKKKDFEVLEKIYDPEGIYKKQYHEQAEKKGLKI